jgi:hypothetical protein
MLVGDLYFSARGHRLASLNTGRVLLSRIEVVVVGLALPE